MARAPRRTLPDNLDSLVDTLSNVVGILIIVVALTRIQVGDALERLVAADAERLPAAIEGNSELVERHRARSEEWIESKARRNRLAVLGFDDLGEARARTEELLSLIDALPDAIPDLDREEMNELISELAGEKAALESDQKFLAAEEKRKKSLSRVPRELVARLPDPRQRDGEQQWVLVRYGRVYLVDRRALFDAGKGAISGILQVDRTSEVRADEFESLAHHFRKRDIGSGPVRWQIVAGRRPSVELAWRDPGAGFDPLDEIDRVRLRRALKRWSPDRDVLRFLVWSDSFEAYLAAREAAESIGLAAGWRPLDEETELVLPIVFGGPDPFDRPVAID